MAGLVCEGVCEFTYFNIVRFSDDDCMKFMLSHGVIPSSRPCGNCGHVLQSDPSLQFRCSKMISSRKQKKKRCSFKSSVFTDSFLARSHLTMRQVIDIVATLLYLKPPRQDFIVENVGVSSPTVIDWYSFVREVLVDDAFSNSDILGGEGCVVEIDEAKFGKRKFNRGRRVEGQWVFGGIERGSRKSFLVPVETRDAETLLGILLRWVRPGTTIMSDCWKAYNNVHEEGFRHFTVNHSVNFVDPDTGAHTNTMERTWREVKATIPRYGVRKGHFVGYLAEYQFKRKYPTKERLHYFFRAAARLYPPPS